MTHLKIEQNTGLIEEVSREVISKLYELASSGDLDQTSDLKGRLHTSSAPNVQVEYLNQTYPELFITADKLTVQFEDPEIQRILETKVFNTTDITASTVRTLTQLPQNSFNNNTKIVKFNEFKDFSGLTILPEQTFYGCTKLEEITFPPALTELPGMIFTNCYKLKQVVLPNSITKTGYQIFWGCTGIEGYIIIPHTVSTITRRIFSMATWDSNVRTTKGVFVLCSNFPTISTDYDDTYFFGGNVPYKLYLKYAHYNQYLALNRFCEGNTTAIRPFKLFEYTSSNWTEIPNPTQAQVREALNNISSDWTQQILPIDGDFPSNPVEGQLSLMEYSSVS